MQLLGGRLSACSLPGDTATDLPTTRAACAAAGGEWRPPPFGSFDNVGSASLLLFEVSTLEGWASVLYAAVDASPERDSAPVAGATPWAALFVVSWVLLGGLVLVNLVVGVLVDTFADIAIAEAHHTRDLLRYGGEAQIWAELMHEGLRLRPIRYAACPDAAAAPLRAACWRLVHARWFEPLVLTIVWTNVAVLAADGYGIADHTAIVLEGINHACTAFFVAELVAKVAAVRWDGYWADGWNLSLIHM